jgi:hypothetical protein
MKVSKSRLVKFGKKISLKFALVQLITHMLTNSLTYHQLNSLILNKETQFILFLNKFLEFEVKNVYSL